MTAGPPARYNRGMVNHYKVHFVKDGDWWLAFTADAPGTSAQGRTLDEARSNVVEAIQLLNECERDQTLDYLRECGLADRASTEQVAVDMDHVATTHVYAPGEASRFDDDVEDEDADTAGVAAEQGVMTGKADEAA